MSKRGYSEMIKVQRRMALRVISAYTTTSTVAALLLAGTAPIELKTKKRSNTFKGTHKDIARNTLLTEWQGWCDSASEGRWTHRLIRNIGKWIDRNYSELNYQLTQVLTGHGCFQAYLKRFAIAESTRCLFRCDSPTDNAEHTVFSCDAWYARRHSLEIELGKNLTPENMVNIIGNKEELGHHL